MENNNNNIDWEAIGIDSDFEEVREEDIAALDKVHKVQLHLATKDEILSWSSGEVTKPETINYKTHKPERYGLFDEVIFGPSKDFKCPVCGKKHKRSDVGKKCVSCGETVVESKMVRRRKMGHIQLNAPVAHIWYSKVDYSVIRSVLGLKQVDYDAIIYFKSYIVYNDGGVKGVKKNTVININNAAGEYFKILKALKAAATKEDYKEAIENKMKSLISEAESDAGQNHGIDFNDYNYFIASVSDVRIGTGAETIRTMMEELDINKEIRSIKAKLQTKQTNNTLYRRLRVLTSFKESKQDPSAMIMDVIPVIPPDLRPLIQLDGGRHSTVDVNELYRRVIIRNNRLGQWLELNAPSLIVQNEKRMLQEAVDALFDNTRKVQPVNSKDGRPLKSLAENLKGKQGRFRQNLLGKRVDYSGRSVIVVGPELKLHQVGLPKQMVVKLFEPFIVNLLVEEGVVKNTKQAKKLIDLFDDRIWKYADRVIKGHPVLINRAPTLHRLSIQAFEPVIVSGKAIQLHPLVTPAFNADFDGDQMAVHVPLSKAAKEEARTLMMSSTNILGPKDGRLILSPSQDMVLGTYYLTKPKLGAKGEFRVYKNFLDIENNLKFNNLEERSIIAVPLSMYQDKFEADIKAGYKYLITTVGRIIINEKLPKSFPFLNEVTEKAFNAIDSKYLVKSAGDLEKAFDDLKDTFVPFKKGNIHRIIEMVYERYPEDIAYVLDELKDLGFWYSMISGTSMAINDIMDIDKRQEILDDGERQVKELRNLYEDGMLTDDQRYQQVLKVWSNVKDDIQSELEDTLATMKDNSLYMMMDSGARGNISNFVQLAGLRGSMAKATHEYAALKRQGILVRSVEEIPIKSSFKTGLSTFEYFLSTHGARKGLSDTATKTAESGYLTRRLVEASQDIHIHEEDCGTDKGMEVKEIYDSRTGATIESLFDRINGRYLSQDIRVDGKKIAKKDDFVTPELAKKIIDAGVTRVWIRSVLTCTSKRGVCKKCYGADLSTNRPVDLGEAVGIVSAQSIGEPGTQLTMRTFHTGGVAGVADITQGFSRLMELVDANKNPKSPAIISDIHGTVSEVKAVDFDAYGHPILFEIEVSNKQDTMTYTLTPQHVLRVSPGDTVKPGDKITEGSIRLQDLLDTGGRRATQSYLLKEIQRLYRIQGIEVNDKYMEVIIRQMLSKVEIVDKGDSGLYQKQVISYDQLADINEKLFEKGKKPAYGRPIVMGIKQLPLYSESWLSAASYQRTADALVSASISKQVDPLHGVKENLIVGKAIPVGTGMEHPEGKYDLHLDNSLEDSLDEDNTLNSDYSDDEIRIVND